MKKTIVLYKRLSDDLLGRLREQAEVIFVDTAQADGLARLRDALPHAHGLLGASLRLDSSLLDLAPQLEAVASVSVGVDNYDIADLTRHRRYWLCLDPGDGAQGGRTCQLGAGRALAGQPGAGSLRHRCARQNPGHRWYGTHWRSVGQACGGGVWHARGVSQPSAQARGRGALWRGLPQP